MRYMILFFLALLSACASTPEFNLSDVNKSLSPKSVIADIDTAKGQRVIWGGVILSSENMKDSTQIEMLAYPLDSSYLPQTDKDPIGRYLINHSGYLETTIYETGRMVSVVGRVEGSYSGKVGEADYVYPLIRSIQLHLWSRDSGRNRTTFHFGLGVQL